jgi:hypothetical protein
MTDLLDRAVKTAQTLPPEMQDEIARLVLNYAGEGQTIVLTPEEEAALEASEQAAARGEFASDAQIRAIWSKYGA